MAAHPTTGATSDTTGTRKYRNRHHNLYDESDEWLVHWRDLSEHLLPRKGKYLRSNRTEQNPGLKRHQKIINGSANDALRIVAAGMQGGLTSPSRPWFRLTIQDEELMEFSPVRNWLHQVRNGMLAVFARSNFYSSIHNVYKELAAFGTSAMFMEEDLRTVVRFRPLTIGEFRLALDSTYVPVTLYRQFSMSAAQMAEKFGEDNLSRTVKQAFKDPHRMDDRFEVIHAMEPKDNVDSRGMTYDSVYFELNTDENDGDKFLRKGGFREKPFVAPRWDVTGVDTYGNSPGMEALGDVKMLQSMETKKLKALAKMVDPPMNAPLALKGKGATVIPGGVNYIDVTAGAQGFTPSYMINPDMQNIGIEIDRVEERIRRFFFNDLFLATLASNKDMTATEVVQRHEEKLLMLGPVTERLEFELFDTIIERTYNTMDSLGMLPPVPPELSGINLEIKYISLLAQAQRIVGLSSIQRTAEFVTNMAGAYPQVLDKFDADEAVDQFSEIVGIPPKIIVSDDKVAEKRQADAEAAAAAAAAQNVAQGIESGKTLSETELGTGSALDSVAEQIGAGV